MKVVKLYGHLGKKFGKSFNLAVSSPAEAIRALSALIPGFKRYLNEHSEPGYHIFIDKENIGEEELVVSSSKEIIKIVPVTMGSGGFFKVIVGIGLLIASGGSAGALMNFGIGMVLSGVSEILFAPPKPTSTSTEKPASTPSYIFNGAINTTGQGNPVPLCYGKLRVGSQVISAGMSAREIPMNAIVTTSSNIFASGFLK